MTGEGVWVNLDRWIQIGRCRSNERGMKDTGGVGGEPRRRRHGRRRAALMKHGLRTTKHQTKGTRRERGDDGELGQLAYLGMK